MANKIKYEFAIQKKKLNSGKEILIPVCRRKSLSKFILLSNQWCRIICIYGIYKLMELDFDPELTHEECQQHINGYKEYLSKSVENNVSTIEVDNIEELICN